MSRSVHGAWMFLPGGWTADVRLDLDANGTITGIRQSPARAGDERLSGLVLPGMPNLHSHGFQRLMSGLTAMASGHADSFWSWREAMYRMALRLGPEELEACMAGVYLEMLCAGYTSCAEFHYLHHAPDGARYDNPAELSERVFAAAAQTGMALTHLPVWYHRSGFRSDAALPEQRRFINELDDYLDIVERCEVLSRGAEFSRVGIAPHSLRAVAPDRLVALLAADGGRRPIHIHVAEQPREVAECLETLGARPVQYLLDRVGAGTGWCLVHATHLDAGECRQAAATGAVAGLCPVTEADLGDGVFPAQNWIEAGGAIGIGSDSNLRICPAEEIRQLECSQRLVTGRRNVLAEAGQSTGANLYARAAAGGARATDQNGGAIEPGRRADLVELDPGHPMLAGLEPDAALATWLFAGGQEMLRSVRVGGRLLVENGRHANEASILPAYRKVLKTMRA